MKRIMYLLGTVLVVLGLVGCGALDYELIDAQSFKQIAQEHGAEVVNLEGDENYIEEMSDYYLATDQVNYAIQYVTFESANLAGNYASQIINSMEAYVDDLSNVSHSSVSVGDVKEYHFTHESVKNGIVRRENVVLQYYIDVENAPDGMELLEKLGY